MRDFRPHAPVVPRQPGSLTDVADDEVRRAVETTSKSQIVNGRTTEWLTLGVLGTTHRIAHKLGRAPVGWVISGYTGFEPKYRIIDVDAKYITLVSLDQVDVCGWFIVDAGSAITSTSATYLGTPSAVSTSVFRVTLNFDCTGLLFANCDSTPSPTIAVEFRESAATFAGPIYVEFTNYAVMGPPTAFISATAFYHVAVTGTAPRCQWWVY